MNRKRTMQEIDSDFDKILLEAGAIRVTKGLENKSLSRRELTRMIKNCPSFQKTLNELSSFPRRKK